MAVRQQALTIVAAVKEASRADLAARLDAVADSVIDALTHVPSLHFARFVLIQCTPGDQTGALRLAFESNHDGEVADHLAEVARALAPFEKDLFESWEGYETGELVAFAASRPLTASTFYLGHPGLSVAQIHNDRALRLRLEALLD